MRTNIETTVVHGQPVESWYNEAECNWEAFILGVGAATAPCDRFDAIQAVLERQAQRSCPICGKPPTLAYIRASDGREWVNSACQPCGYAKDEKNQWTFYVGGMTRLG